MASRDELPEFVRRQRSLPLLLAIPGLTLVAGVLASALAPTLLALHPEVLLALDARPRNLVLTAPLLGAATYFTIGLARWFIADPFIYLVGVQRGELAITWLEKRTGRWGTWFLNLAKRLFDRFGLAMVFIFPSPITCLLAGLRGMPPGRFVAANLIGSAVSIAAFRWFGDFLSAPIHELTSLVTQHMVELTLATSTLVAIGLLLRYRKRKRLLKDALATDRADATAPLPPA